MAAACQQLRPAGQSLRFASLNVRILIKSYDCTDTLRHKPSDPRSDRTIFQSLFFRVSFSGSRVYLLPSPFSSPWFPSFIFLNLFLPSIHISSAKLPPMLSGSSSLPLSHAVTGGYINRSFLVASYTTQFYRWRITQRRFWTSLIVFVGGPCDFI